MNSKRLHDTESDEIPPEIPPEFQPRLFEQEVVRRKKPPIVPRAQWGALPPKKVEPTTLPLRRVFFTLWTDCPPCNTPEECERTMRELQRRHMDEFGLSDIKYNFLVGGDENIYEGRGWYTKSSKVLEMNPHHYLERLDIAFIGDYRNVPHPPWRYVELGIDLVSYAEFLKTVRWDRDLMVIKGERVADWDTWKGDWDTWLNDKLPDWVRNPEKYGYSQYKSPTPTKGKT